MLATRTQEWKQQLKAEGKIEGKIEGKAETLLRLLRRRFYVIPVDIENRVIAVNSEQLDKWIDRLFDSCQLTDIFHTD